MQIKIFLYYPHIKITLRPCVSSYIWIKSLTCKIFVKRLLNIINLAPREILYLLIKQTKTHLPIKDFKNVT